MDAVGGTRRVDGGLGDLRPGGEIARGPEGVPGLRKVTVSCTDSTNVGFVSFDVREGGRWLMSSKP